jgi:DNA-binding FadR family transcriptional regulator
MLTERLHSEIAKRIAAGEWPTGTRLPTEAELSAMFSVSRPVVREALSRLRADGTIETRRGSGSLVRGSERRPSSLFAPLASIADLLRFYEFRIAIECETAGLAAERRNSGHLKALDAAIAGIEHDRKSSRLNFEADFRFHLAVADASGNPFFASAVRLVEDQAKFGMNLSDYFSRQHSRRRIDQIVAEHKAVAEAIRRGDAGAARSAMYRHLTAARSRTVGDEEILPRPTGVAHAVPKRSS